MKKKTIWILGILILLIAVGGIGYKVYASNRSTAASVVQTAAVTNGALVSTLSSSGNTRSGQSATISWETSGKIGDVTLKPGDLVQENQELAALATDSLSTEMSKAKQDLIDARQALDDLLNSKLQQAQALQAVENAQQALDNLKQTSAKESSQAQLAAVTAEKALADAQATRLKMNYPHSTDKLVIEKAQTAYMLAKKTYQEALKPYSKMKDKPITRPERVQALNNLVNAKAAMDTALATYNWYLLGYTANEIAQADSQVAVAQANLAAGKTDYENLKNGASESAIAIAGATLADAQRAWERVKNGPSADSIAAAQAAVEAAQAILAQAALRAPFAGTITEVDVKTGDLISSGQKAFRIDDLASLNVDLQISEVDLTSLKVGQKATLEFDAIANKTYNGEVTEIGMIGTVSQGVVNYPVVVRVTDADANIRPGMTASVTIVVDEVQDALIVPNKALRTSNGQRTVTVLFEGQQITVPVTVGLTSASSSQVISDQLREGDVVLLTGSSSSNSTTGNNRDAIFIGGPFEAGGGPP